MFRARRSLPRFIRRSKFASKRVLVQLHVYSFATKCDAFHPQTQALLCRGFKPEFDLAARADNALPGNAIRQFAA